MKNLILTSILVALSALKLSALDTVTMAWAPSPTSGIKEYRLYFGKDTNVWSHMTSAGLNMQATVELPSIGRWYFIATATDTNGLQSLPSNIVVYDVSDAPSPPDGMQLLSSIITRSSTITTTTNLIVVPQK